MKRHFGTFRFWVAAGVMMACAWLAQAGDINPPAGPVGDTYLSLGFKTLQQVEPRTPVQKLAGSATAQYVITQPGAYYLTGNIAGVANKNGIEISSDGVTLDLGGFSMIGMQTSLAAVVVTFPGSPPDVRRNIVVENGTLVGWGGVGVDLTLGINCRVERIQTTDCAGGIWTAYNSQVRDCRAESNRSTGISVGNVSVVSGCTALYNSAPGITAGTGASILQCVVEVNQGVGIRAGDGSTVSHCTSRNNFVGKGSAPGYQLSNDCTISDSTADNNSGSGCEAVNRCHASRCTFSANSGHGIEAFDDANITDVNASFNNGVGIFVDGGTIVNCTANRNGGNGIASFGQAMTLSNCTVANNLATGILMDGGGSATGCTAVENAGGGIFATEFGGMPHGNAVQISHCVASRNVGDGIAVTDDAIVSGCTSRNNFGAGISARNRCRVSDSLSESNGTFATPPGLNGVGVLVTGTQNRIDSNSVTSNDAGIQITGTGNTVMRNSARGNTNNYGLIVGGNDVGPVGTAATAASPWANIAF